MKPMPAWFTGIRRFFRKFAVITGHEKNARRVVVTVVGVTVVMIGAAMLVLPGPGLVVIPAGLTILASEYSWARRWLKKVRIMGQKVVDGTAPTPALAEEIKQEKSFFRKLKLFCQSCVFRTRRHPSKFSE
jgi:hypothetical protein